MSAGDESVAEGIAAWAAAREAAGEGAETARLVPRSVAEGAVVELCEVTQETVRAICRLQVAPSQRGFVAPNAVSFAEALFAPKAWYRAVVADDVPVGFAMLEDDPDAVGGRQFFLWRFMIGDRFQRRGYGRRALELIADHVRPLGGRELLVSWVPGEGGPERFYLDLGFRLTGEVDGDEVVAALAL